MLGLKFDADIRTLAQTGLYFGLLVVMWCSTLSWAMWLPMYFALAWLSFTGATNTHNTMHCPLFRSRLCNQAFQALLTLTYGHPVSTYVPGHNLSHHQYTQLSKDVMRTTKMRYKNNWMNMLMFQPTIVADTFKADLSFLRTQQILGRPFFDQCVREFGVLMLVQVFLLWSSPWLFLIYWQIPHLMAQWAIVTINLFQHDGCETAPPLEDTGKSSHAPNTARDFIDPVLNYLLNNNGYHSMHHKQAHLHWSLLPEAHSLQIAPYQHPQLLQTSMLAYIWNTYFSPGTRHRYDGKPIDFSVAPVCQEPWQDLPEGITREQVAMNGKLDMLLFAVEMLALFLCKLTSPVWSPVMKLI